MTSVPYTDRVAQNAEVSRGFFTTHRLAGLGALGFAGGVIFQNVVLGAAEIPQANASTSEALAWYEANRTSVVVASGVMSLTVPMLLLFASTMNELGRGFEAGRRWLQMGLLGATALAAVFSVVALSQIASLMLAEAGETQAFAATWALKNSAFAVNMSILGAAFLGFSFGAHAAGLIPGWQRTMGLLGAALLLMAGLANVAIAEGSGLMFLGLAGFVLWMVWLIATGIRMLRMPSES